MDGAVSKILRKPSPEKDGKGELGPIVGVSSLGQPGPIANDVDEPDVLGARSLGRELAEPRLIRVAELKNSTT